jgi:hypothetical protein
MASPGDERRFPLVPNPIFPFSGRAPPVSRKVDPRVRGFADRSARIRPAHLRHLRYQERACGLALAGRRGCWHRCRLIPVTQWEGGWVSPERTRPGCSLCRGEVGRCEADRNQAASGGPDEAMGQAHSLAGDGLAGTISGCARVHAALEVWAERPAIRWHRHALPVPKSRQRKFQRSNSPSRETTRKSRGHRRSPICPRLRVPPTYGICP